MGWLTMQAHGAVAAHIIIVNHKSEQNKHPCPTKDCRLKCHMQMLSLQSSYAHIFWPYQCNNVGYLLQLNPEPGTIEP